MKRFKAVAILVMFAGIILLLQACTPKNGASPAAKIHSNLNIIRQSVENVFRILACVLKFGGIVHLFKQP